MRPRLTVTWIPRLILAIAISSLTTALMPRSTAAVDESSTLVWSSLGPAGPAQVTMIGMADEWPTDPFIIVVRAMDQNSAGISETVDSARSYDGGRTWEPLPKPPFHTGSLLVRRATDNARVLFVNDPISWYGPNFSYRSDNDGESWTLLPGPPDQYLDLTLVPSETFAQDNSAVLNRNNRRQTISPLKPGFNMITRDTGLTWSTLDPAPGRDVDRVSLSPNFAVDHALFTVLGDELLRSTDAGASWISTQPAPGQVLKDPTFSPDYAHDHTLYLRATAGDLRKLSYRTWTGTTPDVVWSEQSVGLLVSRDEGETWSSLSDGLEIDGMPYKLVESVYPSPGYAQDDTLFVAAWGTLVRDVEPRGWRSALFRSRDRGTSWEAVWKGANSELSLELGPAFTSAGAAILERSNTYVISAASTSCVSFGSWDYGASWKQVGDAPGYGGCWFSAYLDDDAASLLMLTSSQGQGSWGLLTDRGTNRAMSFKRPPGWSTSAGLPRPITPRQAPDQTVLAGNRSGVWVLAAEDRSTHGRLPCAVLEDGKIREAWAASRNAQAGLGCPTAPARPAMARLRSNDDYKGQGFELGLEDESPSWWRLGTEYFSGDQAGVVRVSKSDAAWSEFNVPPVEVMAQDYEGGSIVLVPEPNPQAAAYVISSSYWERLPFP